METTFAALDRQLRRLGAALDAAECHGELCGTICAPDGDVDAWLARIFEPVAPDAHGARELRRELEALLAAERARLRGGAMDFTPLLPDDDEPLAERAGALGEWCEGFLFGLGRARIEQFDRLPPDVQEVVRDVVEIARVGIPAADDEGDEAAYAEIVEYLRAGVQLVHDELHPTAPSTVVAAPPGIQ